MPSMGLREVAPIGLEPIRPKMRAAVGIDQLHIDLYLIAEAPHAAFQDITDPKAVADLLHIDRFPLEGEGGAAGDHEAVGILMRAISSCAGTPFFCGRSR